MQNPNYRPVFLKVNSATGKLIIEHDPRLHFSGMAKELFGYLEYLRQKYGFISVKIETIRLHLKKQWKHNPQTCGRCKAGKPCDNHPNERQVRRLIDDFIALGIISEKRGRIVGKRRMEGWEPSDHMFWSERSGHVCEFKWLEKLPSRPKSKGSEVHSGVTPEESTD